MPIGEMKGVVPGAEVLRCWEHHLRFRLQGASGREISGIGNPLTGSGRFLRDNISIEGRRD
jgi:hypothetical protein